MKTDNNFRDPVKADAIDERNLSLPGIWSKYEPDSEKTARAKKVQFIYVNNANGNPLAECKGSRGEVYSVSLEECTCVDFSKNKRAKPCKHMIALAMKCNLLNENGLTYEQDYDLTSFELSMKVAIASGYYHVFKKPIISDHLYNALKHELWDWCGMLNESDVTDLDTTMNADDLKLFRMPLNDFQLYIKNLLENQGGNLTQKEIGGQKEKSCTLEEFAEKYAQ